MNGLESQNHQSRSPKNKKANINFDFKSHFAL